MPTPQENSIPMNKNETLLTEDSRRDPFKSHFMGIPTFILYGILNLQCALSISSFTPIEKTLVEHYELNTSTVVLSSTLFLIGNAISVFLVFPINKNLGLSWTIRIGLIFNFVGAGLRIFINQSFYFVLFGQFLMGVSSCFVYNNQMEFNFNWFHPKNRAIYNSILTLSVYIGGGLGNSVPLFFVDNKLDSQEEAHLQVKNYCFYMFLFIGVLCLLTILIFRGEPPSGYGYVPIIQDTLSWRILKSLKPAKKFSPFPAENANPPFSTKTGISWF